MMMNRSWPNLRYYVGIRLDRVSETTKNLNQHSLSLGRVLNPEPPEYEAEVLTARPRRSVKLLQHGECSKMANKSVNWTKSLMND
jgi:hypothetical protein